MNRHSISLLTADFVFEHSLAGETRATVPPSFRQQPLSESGQVRHQLRAGPDGGLALLWRDENPLLADAEQVVPLGNDLVQARDRGKDCASAARPRPPLQLQVL